jgi:polyferredoxin/thioredoxin-like negative regulator of GroEL
MAMPGDIEARTCSAGAAAHPHSSGSAVSLPVLGGKAIRKSKMGPRRAAVLVAVHVVMAVHIVHWLVYGMTLSPVEPSEAMYTINMGKVNTGFVFFALAIVSTLVFGRYFCGWGCHVVALQDLCGWAMKKAGVKPRPFRSRLLVWAPLVLAVYMFLWPTIKREVIRPIVGAEGWKAIAPYVGEVGKRPEFQAAFLTEHFWETFPPWYVAIPFLLLCGFAVVYFLGAKGFCTYGCPYGGFFGPADRVAPGRIRVTDACEHCGHCTAVCTSNVRVHEEVRDYGMVVDPGCMKCMDCVSVCPNEALYFGFGKPALVARPRVAKAAKFKSRVYDLSWKEEIAYGLVFVGLVVGFRGMMGLVPLLMAMGMAGIGTYLIWKAVSVARLPNVRVHGWQLRLKGRVRPAGWAMVGAAVVIGGVGAWGVAVNGSSWWGTALDERIETPLDAVLTRGYQASEAERAAAKAALGHLRIAGPAEAGGWGWDRSVDRTLRVVRLEAMAGNVEGAEGELRAALRWAKRNGRASPSQVEDALIRLVMLRSADAAAAEKELKALTGEYQDLSSAWLWLGRFAGMRGAKDEAREMIRRGVDSRPGDVRNGMFAAEMLVGLGEAGEAVAVAERVVERNPRSVQARARLGLLLAATGRMEDGLREMKAAAALDPANREVAGHVAGMLRELGREAEASEWENRANR